MKMTYKKPCTKVFAINTERQLLAGSDVAVGQNFSEGDEVLSRRSGGRSVWDDDEDEEY